MKIFRLIVVLLIISVVLTASVIAGVALYMQFYGKGIVESALSNMFGAKVEFGSVSWNLDKGTANFKGFSIINEIDFDKKIFNAEKMVLTLNKEKLEKEKKVIFDEIYIKNGLLNIVRDNRGIFNLSHSSRIKFNDGCAIAYADEGAMNGALYNFAKSVRKFVIENSTISFKDYFISQQGFMIICDKLNVNFTADLDSVYSSGFVPIGCALNFRIPGGRYGDGFFSLTSSMAAYQDKIDTETVVETQRIDLMQFLPYFEKYTPFTFNEGLFSSSTNFKMHNNIIDSLTTIVFHRIRLHIDPGMENAEFLAASVNQLAKYLTSGQGEILFDFVIKGPANNPGIGLGPKVKFAIGLVVIEELGKMMQQIQEAYQQQ